MATGIELDYVKLDANQHITVAIGTPDKILNVGVPLPAELNALQPASVSISWNDWDFGIQASEVSNDPSLADVANYETRGAANYGGGISFYYPKEYDDNTNNHSIIYDLTDIPRTMLLVAIRVDGEKKTSRPFAVGDRVHVFLVQTDSETNSLQGADALRRTVGMLQQSVFAVYTTVGSHAITPESATVSATVGEKARILVKCDGREATNSLTFRSSAPNIVEVHAGGVYVAKAAGTATITATDTFSGNSTTIAVTVA